MVSASNSKVDSGTTLVAKDTAKSECNKVVNKDSCSKVGNTKIGKDVTVSYNVVNEVSSNNTGFRASKVARVTEVKDAINSKMSAVSNTVKRLIKKYDDVFDESQVGLIQGKDYDIKLRTNYTLVIHAARRIPFYTLIRLTWSSNGCRDYK